MSQHKTNNHLIVVKIKIAILTLLVEHENLSTQEISKQLSIKVKEVKNIMFANPYDFNQNNRGKWNIRHPNQSAVVYKH